MRFSLYGALVGLGVVVALRVAEELRERRGEDGRVVWEVFWWVILPGLLGARMYHVLGEWAYYSEDFKRVFEFWNGGVGIMGGVLGGLLGLGAFSYYKSKNESEKIEELFFGLGDVLAIGALVGQALGRWGNFFNKELYGRRTDLPWGITVPNLRGFYHPIFLYESFLNIVLFVILLFTYKGKGKRGEVLASYLIGYGLIRIILDNFRHEAYQVYVWGVEGLQIGEVVGAVFVLLGVLVLRRRRSWV